MRTLEEIGQLDRLGRAGEFSSWLRCMAAARGAPVAAARIAHETKAPRRVVDILEKAPVGGMHFGDTNPLDQRLLAAAFVDTLRSESGFMRLYPDTVRVPFNARVSVVGTAVPAGVVAAGAGIPLRALALSSTDVAAAKVAVMVAVSKELLDSAPQDSEAMISSSLKASASAALDAAFVAVAISGVSATSATAAPLTDLKVLMAAVVKTGAERLYWLSSVSAAQRIAGAVVTGGARLFGDAGPVGGTLMGIPLVVSSAVASDHLLLVDASGFAARVEPPEVDFAESADLTMADNPSDHSLTPTAATKVSMFQTNSVAIRCTLRYGLARFRAGSVARLTGIGW